MLARVGVLLSLGLMAPVAASAATIGDDRFGCASIERMHRIYRVANQGDEATFTALLNDGFASGDCIRWSVGESVAELDRDGGLLCLAARGTTRCYWTPREAIE